MNSQLINLFREELDIAPLERAAYLDAQQLSPELRAQLDALLLAAEQTGSRVIKLESAGSMAQIAQLMQQNTALKLHVVGHTDNQGSLDSNFALSKARAAAVSAALSAQYGIAAARLSANGVSSLAPVASNADDAGRAKNRRVELVPF